MATTRERLRELLDELPEDRLDDAEAAIAALAAPPFRPPSEAPEDDEPVTDEDRKALADAHEAYLRGELIPHDIAMREIGLRAEGSLGSAVLWTTSTPSPVVTGVRQSESAMPSSNTSRGTKVTYGSSRAAQMSIAPG